MQPLTAQFKHYLVSQKLSAATLKNYVSDIRQFLAWLAGELQETVIEPVHLTASVFQNYGRWLNDPANRIHPATAERYLSSLKRFGSFLENAKLTDANPAADLKPAAIDPTLDQVINEFKRELIHQKLSGSTVKNYVSDVHHYLLWANEHLKLTGDNLLKL